jgi:CPA2 family monovalent cation:H+ antiporter-2
MDTSALFVRDLGVIMLSALAGGWLARLAKLSPIVGYLLAGILIGTPEVAFPYVTEPERVEVLSSLGLIFLMFSIGLGLRLRNILDLGIGPIAATILTALLVMNITRGIAAAAGLSPEESLFLAAMFMVSSSAIIGKVLQDSGLNHLRHGQLALGMTLMEDVVAVIMLTFVTTYAASGSLLEDPLSLLRSVGLLIGFVLLLVVVGIVILPRILHRVNLLGQVELETILLTGILFALSLSAVLAGYSMALGALLTGMLVAETPRLSTIQRTFSGMRDVFTTVFFVSIGMSLNVHLIPAALPLIIGGTFVCIGVRVTAAFLSLLAVCEDAQTSLRSALSVTPIGEFSFIIAGVGVASGVLPPEYQVAAVGISLLTSLLSPILIVRSETVAGILLARRPHLAGSLLTTYRQLWTTLGARGDRSVIWRLSQKRLIQIAIEALVVSAVIVFARPLSTSVANGLSKILPQLPGIAIFWTLVVGICLGPLIAIWRNGGVLSMILAEAMTNAQPQFKSFERSIQIALRGTVAILMLLWLGSILPVNSIWGLLFVPVVIGLFVTFNWKQINRWHSSVEYDLQGILKTSGGRPELSQVATWGLTFHELTLPDYFAHAGRTIGELGLRKETGASIISIERQGFRLNTPTPQTHLFPGDELLILGDPDQIRAARKLLMRSPEESALKERNKLNNTVLEVVRVPGGSPIHGSTLASLSWPRLFGVQVVGVRRGQESQITPGSSFAVHTGDELLLLGSPESLRRVETTM